MSAKEEPKGEPADRLATAERAYTDGLLDGFLDALLWLTPSEIEQLRAFMHEHRAVREAKP